MNEEKKKNIVIILLLLIVIMLSTLIILLLTDTVSVNKDNSNNNDVEISEDLISDNSLNKIAGSWGRCNGLSCYFLTIEKNDDEYSYNAGQYGSDGGLFGNVIEQKIISNDKLYIQVCFPKRVTEISETIEQTNEYIINISKLNFDIIVVNNTEYEKITGSFDDFFNTRVSE